MLTRSGTKGFFPDILLTSPVVMLFICHLELLVSLPLIGLVFIFAYERVQNKHLDEIYICIYKVIL